MIKWEMRKRILCGFVVWNIIAELPNKTIVVVARNVIHSEIDTYKRILMDVLVMDVLVMDRFIEKKLSRYRLLAEFKKLREAMFDRM